MRTLIAVVAFGISIGGMFLASVHTNITESISSKKLQQDVIELSRQVNELKSLQSCSH